MRSGGKTEHTFEGMRDVLLSRWGLALLRSAPMGSVTSGVMSSVSRGAEAQGGAVADFSDKRGMTCLRQSEAGPKTPWYRTR